MTIQMPHKTLTKIYRRLQQSNCRRRSVQAHAHVHTRMHAHTNFQNEDIRLRIKRIIIKYHKIPNDNHATAQLYQCADQAAVCACRGISACATKQQGLWAISSSLYTTMPWYHPEGHFWIGSSHHKTPCLIANCSRNYASTCGKMKSSSLKLLVPMQLQSFL